MLKNSFKVPASFTMCCLSGDYISAVTLKEKKNANFANTFHTILLFNSKQNQFTNILFCMAAPTISYLSNSTKQKKIPQNANEFLIAVHIFCTKYFSLQLKCHTHEHHQPRDDAFFATKIKPTTYMCTWHSIPMHIMWKFHILLSFGVVDLAIASTYLRRKTQLCPVKIYSGLVAFYFLDSV